ncbi:MAG: c-type cytochrome [Chitinophagaceae bacterium]|nr:MAG: c-type cytochrome [Chitinophagaceae bacterium]
MRRKMLILSSIVLVIAFCSVSFKEEPTFKNLKVLSKKTTNDELEIIMKEFKTALGVKCGFCHAASKTDPKKLDFASDENKHKDVARDMMRMSIKINKKYFRENKDTVAAITCFTCHRGDKEPKEAPKEVLDN